MLNYDVKKIDGKKNIIADALSRQFARLLPYDPKDAVMRMAHQIHLDYYHPGGDKVYHLIKDRVKIYPGMKEAIIRMCQRCPICQRTNPKRKIQGVRAPVKIDYVTEKFSMDFADISPPTRPKSMYYLLLPDYASRYLHGFVTYNEKGPTAVNCL